ncbi:Chromodomain protein [Phytophthora cinnamomi]|uniref:Chromodomain protein n=1 Tax=Phytophthora cinnamomi TaxID=4785 RepID=UPI00355AA062|nr:Chromodomain protein [Phytophthora cinnamomi]
MVLNHTPSPAMGGVAPVTAMTGLKAMSPADHIEVPGPVKQATLAEVQTAQRARVERLQRALADMHKRSSKANAATRAAGRKHHNKKQSTTMAQFEIGDFVLYADVWQHTRSKLRVKSCGLAQVVNTVSNWMFEIQNRITEQRKEAHASRLKFYADASLDVSEDLLLHVAHNSEGHVVETLLKARYNQQEKRHEIKVHWRGLDAIEDSWEQADILLQDVPVAVKVLAHQHKTQAAVKALCKALSIDNN